MNAELCVSNTVEARAQRSQNWNSAVLLGTKRAIDVGLTALLLILLAPLYAFLAVGVKLTSRGPILYKWPVVGEGGRPFTGYKFRSMQAGADKMRKQLEHLNEMRGPVFKLTNDPRVTRFGVWMRRYSLDELPQLWNVLKGQMSLVGPRPPLVTEFERFTDYQKLKLTVRSGMTCIWQINGRNCINNFDDWIEFDLEYIRHWSLWLDFRILLKTIFVVIAGTGM